MKLIPLSSKKPNSRFYNKYSALVDDEDYGWLNKYIWCVVNPASGLFYARTFVDGKPILMHRLILSLKDKNVFGEHCDGNGLNNQRHNLREASNSDNQKNKKGAGASKYLGVGKYGQRWRAQIKSGEKNKHIGAFDNEEAAALAYDFCAMELHGKFARLNFPPKAT